jgi:NAD(P)-dependent dehydrogenase (short-subunit alcohol dehydrogenase family)
MQLTPRLDGRVAVITGGGRGIGLATAEALAANGAAVLLADRGANLLPAAAERVRRTGARCEAVVCDVREEASVMAMAEAVRREFGKVHVLVNSAGTAIRKNVVDFTLDEWRMVVETNLTGTFLPVKYLVPLMRGHGWGRIINLSSIMGHVSTTGRGVYSATKHGVLGLTKALAQELVGEGITVNAISPGFVATELTAPLRANPERNAELMAATPMKRWGMPEEIASLALYLCSDGAAFMTGTDVLADGGWVAQ